MKRTGNVIINSVELISVENYQKKNLAAKFTKDWMNLSDGGENNTNFKFMSDHLKGYMAFEPFQSIASFLRTVFYICYQCAFAGRIQARGGGETRGSYSLNPDTTQDVQYLCTSGLMANAVQKFLNAPPSDRKKCGENLLNNMALIKVFQQHLVTFKFLFCFDHRCGKFYLNEYSHFNLATLKTKILFYFNERGNVEEYDNFVNNLYSVSKQLSARPKFQLALVCLCYMITMQTDIMVPVLTKQFDQRDEITNLENRVGNLRNLKSNLVKLLVQFDLFDIFSGLLEIIPKAVEMQLFLMSDSYVNIEWQRSIAEYEKNNGV